MHMMLQHNDEICVSVNATKVKRNQYDGAWLNPKHYIMSNQQLSS
jgi:hypothetical protein